MKTKQQHKDIYQPFCYLIGWSKQKTFYYGVRYARGTTPNDLWTKYYTSSKYVKLMCEQHGEPDIIEVRKTFKTAEEAICWEERVIRRIGAVKKSEWLNRNNTSTGTRGIVNVPKTQAQKDHQSKMITGKVHTQKTRDKIAEGLRKYKRTKEHAEALSKALTGIKKPSLMTGEYSTCLICNSSIYNTRWCLNKGYIRRTCGKECKSILKYR